MSVRIHHTQKAQASKIGVLLTAEGELVKAFWPEHNTQTLGKTAAEAIEKMREVQDYVRNRPEEEPTEEKEELADVDPDDMEDDAELKDGVPTDGGVAFEREFSSADCPYSSEIEDEYDDFVRWNEEWEAAFVEGEEEKPGSVVKEEYRARYAEAGHPTTCGDDMATVLDNLCKGKSQTDLDRFETICEANGVSLAKYNRTTNGWQGRLRMTGRNLLAKRVFEAGGVLVTPVEGAEPEYQMSQEWMSSQRYRKADK